MAEIGALIKSASRPSFNAPLFLAIRRLAKVRIFSHVFHISSILLYSAFRTMTRFLRANEITDELVFDDYLSIRGSKKILSAKKRERIR